MREDFEILGGMVISNSDHIYPKPVIESYRHLTLYLNKVFSAWTEVSADTCPSRVLLRFPGGAIWKLFEFSERVGDVQFFPSKYNYLNKIILSPWYIPT